MLGRKQPTPPAIVLQPTEVARRNGTSWVVRPEPFRLMWTLDDIVAGDGIPLRIEFSASVQLLTDAAEQTLFGETFGGSAGVTEDAVRRHFASPLMVAARRFAGSTPAEALLSGSSETNWINVLQPAAEALAFGCGLRVQPPARVEVTSPEWDRRRREQSQRADADRNAADRLSAARQTAQLLEQWQSVHAQWPDVSPGQLLNRLSVGDRATAVADILAATPATAARFWAAAGGSLVRLDWIAAPAEPVVIPLPATLGPLRSIRVSGDRLFVGARRGVWVLDGQTAAVRRELIGPELTGEHGYTAAVEAGELLWASHREAGLVAWNAASDPPACRIGVERLGGPPSALQIGLDGEICVAVENRLLAVAADQTVTTKWSASSPIVAVLTGDGVLQVVCRDGTVTQLDPEGSVVRSRPTLPRVSTACRVPWMWSHRLLMVGEDGTLCCFGREDDVVTQFSGIGAAGRAVAAAGGKLVTVTADRNHLVGWSVADGRQPAINCPVSHLTRSRAVDVAAAAI